MTFKNFRRLRNLMVPSDSTALLARADLARDERRWTDAIDLYRDFVKLHPDRNGLLMQSGHCFKESGFCEEALHEYLAVSDEIERPEADYQAGELLKLTGNVVAARGIFSRSAGLGHTSAGHEIDRLARGEVDTFWRFYRLARETGQNETDALTKLFAAEIAPLNWRRLAAAAEVAAVWGETGSAELLADLALIVGGVTSDRYLGYKAIFVSSGLWGDSYKTALGSAAQDTKAPHRAVADLLNAFDFSAVPQTEARASLAPNVRMFSALESQHELLAIAHSFKSLRTRLFEDDVASADLIDHIRGLRELPVKIGTTFVTLPSEGNYSLVDSIRRVSVNVALVVAERLLATADSVPAGAIKAMFSIPTTHATLATSAAGDPVPHVAGIEGHHEDLATAHKRNELEALGILPTEFSIQSDKLFRLADQGHMQPLEYWYRMNAMTASPALIGQVGIRLGNALRQKGMLEDAGLWIERAANAMPNAYTLDLALINRARGNFEGAVNALSRALSIDPENEAVARELNAVVPEVLNSDQIDLLSKEFPKFGDIYRAGQLDARRFQDEALRHGKLNTSGTVLDISNLRENLDFGTERLEVHQIGWLQADVGQRRYPRLVGIISVRACHITRDPPLKMRVRIDGRTVDVVEPSFAGMDSTGKGKYYFNSWIDTGPMSRGPAQLQIYVEQKSSAFARHDATVIIDDLDPDESYERSDAFVHSEPGFEGSLVERVLAREATAREAARSAFDRPVRRVLVMRLDQLGDLSASMPAIRRLRETFPNAHFEGLVTPVNAYILKACGLFDEVFTVDFAYDHGSRKRWLARRDHALLVERYANNPVDIAIDLSPGDDSRPVLKLINAQYRAGFKPHRFDFLDFGIDLLTRDPVNRKEAVSHTAMIGAFVEALVAMFRPPPLRFPADPSLAQHLTSFDLEPKKYIAIHVGARLAIKRWPLGHYIQLAKLLRDEAKLKIVLFSDDEIPADQVTAIEEIGGITTLAGRTEFEVFDALVSNAAVFIGNDTGPKHLASMRGVSTVSVHMDQVNWNEWGQDGDGLIVSKRIPCCGCGIEDPTECGKAMACLVGLTPREIADAVQKILER